MPTRNREDSIHVLRQSVYSGELLQLIREIVHQSHSRQNGRPKCLDGHQAVSKASLARSSQDLKQSAIMINHLGGFQARAKQLCLRIAAALHLSAFKIYWKNMEEQDSHKI